MTDAPRRVPLPLELAARIAAEVAVLQDRRDPDGSHGGRDVDCAVAGLHRFWPLRVPAPFRLCQALEYDIASWYLVFDADGEVVALDFLADRAGYGRYGFPAGLATASASDDGAVPAPPAVRAAYLTVKRLRKGANDAESWSEIAELAADDRDRYGEILHRVLGRRIGRRLAAAVVGDGPIADDLWSSARRTQRLRRYGSPARVLVIPALRSARVARRIARPTGLHVVVAGPDGTGKTTVAGGIVASCEGLFRRTQHLHSRPRMLPRPGALVGRQAGDTSRPHDRPPHGRTLSLALLGYHWLDVLLGQVKIRAFTTRSGLVVVERGWSDLAVDPARYRLAVSPRVVAALGRLLPSPDLMLVLTARPETILARKQELPFDELDRQLESWKRVAAERPRTLWLDAEKPAHSVVTTARGALVTLLESRAVARSDAGWVALPTRARFRWVLPRGPRTVARTSLGVYNPMTTKTRVIWETTRAFAGIGGFRLLPRSDAPPDLLREVLADHMPPGSTYAIARSNHPGRFIALVVDARGEPYAVAKIAVEESARAALRHEADALESHARFLSPPLTAPSVLARGDDILLLGAAAWRPRRRPWEIPLDVAEALGQFFRATRQERSEPVGFAHGDFAPWNLLRTDEEWVLIDWEAARDDVPPFFDLFHYLVQAHSLLGQPRVGELYAAVHSRGEAGGAVAAYAEGAGIPREEAPAFFAEYLRSAQREPQTMSPVGLEGVRIRERLLEGLDHE